MLQVGDVIAVNDCFAIKWVSKGGSGGDTLKWYQKAR